MTKWKKAGNYRQGIVYGCGHERKVVISGSPVFCIKLDTKEGGGTRIPAGIEQSE